MSDDEKDYLYTDDMADYKYDDRELSDPNDYRYGPEDSVYDTETEIADYKYAIGAGTGQNMRVCIVAEGCYPYVVGGVSGWIHSLIHSFPNMEFILLTIVANRSMRGKFVYELPDNLTQVHEVYLEDVDWVRKRKEGISSLHLSEKEYRALRCLILNQHINWHILFGIFRKRNVSLNDLLMGEDFYRAVRDCYDLQYSQIVFSDFYGQCVPFICRFFCTENERAAGGFVPLCSDRICRSARMYGKRSAWKPDFDFRTWHLYQRTGRRAD
ncbi:hypothetical protein C823_003878 [Eubacterium plexicaudatum ASF492]|nr:hypothetical protein C823_003878 [Eubacterium plexicaudatum ASF492]